MGHITADNVGKAYRRYPRKWGRLAEWIGMRPQHELRWALRNVTFRIAPGEAVGVIGLNGAGKSTLLKILAGTTQPTEGTFHVGGRVAALLELGIGFHPEFTGRENVYMAGQLRGVGRQQLDGLMHDIEAFADIGDYIDQPLRTYSSGMQVRLAFSVATAIRPEILIVDEALSVGDVLFQQKCFDRIRTFRDEGTTLLFVSHALAAVYSLCTRALLLQGGRVIADSSPKQAIDLYNALVLQAREPRSDALSIAHPAVDAGVGHDADTTEAVTVNPANAFELQAGGDPAATSVGAHESRPRLAPADRVGSYSRPEAEVASVELLQDGRPVTAFVSESDVIVEIRARFHAALEDPHVGFQIRDRRGEALFMTNTHCMHMRLGGVRRGDELVVRFGFRGAFAPGDYTITAGVADGGLLHGSLRDPLIRVHDARAFSVLENVASIVWAGVYNIAPTCVVERAPAFETRMS
jgi:lipopolysaccharide transport system ATP-binding protein